MKTKFKDFLLYSLACVGAISLFLSAYQPQQTTSTVPESHVWEVIIGDATTNSEGRAYMWNKVTGEVRKISRTFPTAKTLGVRPRDLAKAYLVMDGVNIE